MLWNELGGLLLVFIVIGIPIIWIYHNNRDNDDFG